MAPRRSARNKGNPETDAVAENVTTKPKVKATKKKPTKAAKPEESEVKPSTNGKQTGNVEEENVDATPNDDQEDPKKSAKASNTKTTNKKGAKKAAPNDDTDAPPNEDTEAPPKKKTKAAVAEKKTETDKDSGDQTIYEFKANNIKGEEISLADYKGHVCIIVNVASRCGHTKSNYEQLVQLDEKYSESKGLRILAFPCNQFGHQEPGDAQKICEFAEKRNVKFDMFDKIDVNGKNAHPLWSFLQGKIAGPKGNKIDWNFTKFVISKEGKVVERFKSSVKPLDMVEALEEYW